MLRIIDDFKTYPKSVQTGLVLLALSWIWFFFSMQFFIGIELSNRELVAGAGVLVMAATMKNWARWLCIMCNVMACLYCAVLALAIEHPTILILSAVLFAISTYYLLIKSSSQFYKTYNYID